MIVVRILGGLGNQLFQYAYAKSLASKGYQVKIDISSFKNYKLHGGYQLHEFKIDLPEASKWESFIAKYGFRIPMKEKSLLFQKRFLKPKKNAYIKGYFQTEKYFKDIRGILLKQIIVKKQLSSSTIKYLEKITIKKNTCAIHIRRGDYILDEKANKVHGVCGLNYYKEAIKLMREKCGEISFFVFSDDISWVKKNLKIKNAVYIDHNVIPHEDMHLMSLCNHNITANSSFSWWAAWLNQHKNKIVIAPKNWFVSKENEVACKDWILL
ncbi:alpha-1,2-fucosyltransferase [Polaribacter gangjinensis]|uniref:Alpha-1,2-fucosyltransferase n=1 Tax=Polaribacter gangjinensis TaxID=574710 RepID=A0A2S7W8K4_9FLAO|nr:alpha-1,2-fucosyltransferase [Polaribacter gangjinensis]PQJ73964.1 alpha-1,2-fucosyltransferase [Polaribacter gangjinensis]